MAGPGSRHRVSALYELAFFLEMELKEVETLRDRTCFWRSVQPLHSPLCPFLGPLPFWTGPGSSLGPWMGRKLPDKGLGPLLFLLTVDLIGVT